AHELHRLRVIYLRRMTEELRELARSIAREDIRDEVLEVRLREVAHLRKNAIHPSLANEGQVARIGEDPLPTPSPGVEAMLPVPVRMRRDLEEALELDCLVHVREADLSGDRVVVNVEDQIGPRLFVEPAV